MFGFNGQFLSQFAGGWRQFAYGCWLGVVMGAGMMGLQALFSVPDFSFVEMQTWLQLNLGFSVYLFIAILLIYVIIAYQLQQQLKLSLAKSTINQASPGQQNVLFQGIMHRDQVLELLISLAFGVGVIWTAIGMREALMAAFGDNNLLDSGGSSALQMLKQLIDGGILTALTSTVVGGSLGYFLRLIKTLKLARGLNQFYQNLQSQSQKPSPEKNQEQNQEQNQEHNPKPKSVPC